MENLTVDIFSMLDSFPLVITGWILVGLASLFYLCQAIGRRRFGGVDADQ